jgi:hypothetical protein
MAITDIMSLQNMSDDSGKGLSQRSSRAETESIGGEGRGNGASKPTQRVMGDDVAVSGGGTGGAASTLRIHAVVPELRRR